MYRALYWNALRGVTLCQLGLMSYQYLRFRGERGHPAERGASAAGSVGPETLRAVMAADAVHLAGGKPSTAAGVIGGMADHQTTFYRRLPEFGRFGRSWLDRTERRRQAAMAMLRGTPMA
jgi:lysozyme family protein